MSLQSAKVLYIFLDVTQLSHQRCLFEDILSLRIIEQEPHFPHHQHGVIKYDAGDTILSLNIANSKFDRSDLDGIITVFSTFQLDQIKTALHKICCTSSVESKEIFRDQDNHQYLLRPIMNNTSRVQNTLKMPEKSHTYIQELHLNSRSMIQSLNFYRDILGLKQLNRDKKTATFTTGNINLVIYDFYSLNNQIPIRNGGYLTVFHVWNIHTTYYELSKRGLEFQTPIGFSEIGGTAKFLDPTGHQFCLYEPSRECLSWSSGSKVKEIIANNSN